MDKKKNNMDKVKFKRVNSVRILKDIVFENGMCFPNWRNTRIELDKTNPVKRKCHQLIYQQGPYYGSVGDRCEYLTHEQLFKLEADGLIKIND